MNKPKFPLLFPFINISTFTCLSGGNITNYIVYCTTKSTYSAYHRLAGPWIEQPALPRLPPRNLSFFWTSLCCSNPADWRRLQATNNVHQPVSVPIYFRKHTEYTRIWLLLPPTQLWISDKRSHYPTGYRTSLSSLLPPDLRLMVWMCAYERKCSRTTSAPRTNIELRARRFMKPNPPNWKLKRFLLHHRLSKRIKETDKNAQSNIIFIHTHTRTIKQQCRAKSGGVPTKLSDALLSPIVPCARERRIEFGG